MVNEKPIISYCLEKFSNHTEIDKIQIVADESWHDFINDNFDGEISEAHLLAHPTNGDFA